VLARLRDQLGDIAAMQKKQAALKLSTQAYQLLDDLRVLDLDDPAQLLRLGLRPTQIVIRSLTVTQAWGHRIWSETDPHTGDHVWQAVSWWSYHRPVWTVLASWVRPGLVRVEPLNLGHPALLDAGKALQRIIA
jgi:hypothetical protein